MPALKSLPDDIDALKAALIAPSAPTGSRPKLWPRRPKPSSPTIRP